MPASGRLLSTRHDVIRGRTAPLSCLNNSRLRPYGLEFQGEHMISRTGNLVDDHVRPYVKFRESESLHATAG
jgi:hypothetical protein